MNKLIENHIDKCQFIDSLLKEVLKQMDLPELILFLENKIDEYFKIHNYQKWFELSQTDDYVFSEIDDFTGIQAFLTGKEF